MLATESGKVKCQMNHSKVNWWELINNNFWTIKLKIGIKTLIIKLISKVLKNQTHAGSVVHGVPRK